MQLRKIADEDSDASVRLYQIEVTMQDYNGQRVTADSTCLHVSVENGRLLGLENGDLADVTDYSAAWRRAYCGQLLIYVLTYEGDEAPIVTVTAEGICPAQLTLA